MAASIFSIIDGLTVDRADIVEAELFAEQYLSAQFPTYDFRQGTALRDMTVRPNATLLAIVNKAIKYYFDESDVSNITNDTDNDVVDSRLSNFFIKRQSGDKAIVRSRLYFSFPTATPQAVSIPVSTTFSIDNQNFYSPQGFISVNPLPDTGLREEGKYYFEFDSAESLHYVDIDLESSGNGPEFNIEEGDLLYFSIFSPYFLQGTILYLVGAAIDTETNEQMVDRAYSSVSTRNLINSPSIVARVADQFNYVNEVYPVGLGNPLLYRDLIDIEDSNDPGTYISYHRGGMTDVYIDTDPVIQSLQFTTDAAGTFYVSGPVFSLRQSSMGAAGNDPDTLPANTQFSYSSFNVSRYDDEGVPATPMTDIGLSANQVTKVVVSGAIEGSTITFDLETFSGVNAVHTAINSEEQRVVCADYLVRSFIPSFVDVLVTKRTGEDSEEAMIAVEDYIKSIPAGGTLYVSAVISAIQNAGVTDFILPIDVKAITQNRYIEYSTIDSNIVDTVITDVTDRFDIPNNGQLYPRNIDISEVTLP